MTHPFSHLYAHCSLRISVLFLFKDSGQVIFADVHIYIFFFRICLTQNNFNVDFTDRKITIQGQGLEPMVRAYSILLHYQHKISAKTVKN